MTAPHRWLRCLRAFAAADDRLLSCLHAACHIRQFEPGETIIAGGEVPAALGVMLGGRAVLEEGSGYELGPGAPLGEAEFFAGLPAAQSLHAARSCLVLLLPAEEFQSAVSAMPELWAVAAAGLAAPPVALPLRRPPPRSVAIVTAGETPLPREFIEAFADALDGLAECQVLSSSGLGQHLPGGIALDDPAVAHWLDQQAARFGVVVAVADATLTPWSRAAIARADDVLLVGLHDGRDLGPPLRLSPVEDHALALRGPLNCRLVLARGEGRPSAMRRWQELRPVLSAHHAVLADRASIARLARFVLGRSVGFAATGSGVPAAANLGAVKALQAGGVALDMFGGTGSGGGLAALLAAGFDADDIDAMMLQLAAERRLVPGADHRAFDRALEAALPAVDLADLPVPFAGMVADLSAGVLRSASGSLAGYVRAVWPPAGVLAPYISEFGVVLAGGGVPGSEPLTAPLLAAGTAAEVLCRVVPPGFGPAGIAYRDLPGRLGNAAARLTRRDAEAAVLPSLAVRLALAENAALPAQAAGDMVLQPPVLPGIDPLDFTRHPAVKEAAYRWALGELDRWSEAGEGPLAAAPER